MFTNKKYGLHAKDMYGLISSKNKIISLYLYVCQKECIECVCKKNIVEMNLEKRATGPFCAWGGSLVLGLMAPLKNTPPEYKKLTCKL